MKTFRKRPHPAGSVPGRLLMLSLGAYILNALMWLFIDGDIGMGGSIAEDLRVGAVSLALIICLTAVSMACMWGLTRLFPPSYDRPWQLVAYAFVLFLVNNVIAAA